jgi:predicted alpha/beta superfamily hydrolase
VIELRVHYPPEADVALRTSLDWSVDVEPAAVFDGGSQRLFRVPVPEQGPPLLYAKPIRRQRDGSFDWAQGTNYLVVAGEQAIYPYFDGSMSGCLTDRLQLGRRTVRVFLPPGYGENTEKQYPTLYVLDGANVFLPEEAFSGEDWALDDTLDQLDALNLVDKIIVVAVYSVPAEREDEYTEPGYRRFGEQLVQEVMPRIDERYRTLGRPEATAIMGSSLGGVAALHVAWTHPDAVGMCACLSSTFGYRDDLLRRIWTERLPQVRVYLDAGLPYDNHRSTREVFDLLVARGMSPGRDVLFLGFPGALHHERAWAQRVHLPLQFFFGHAFRAVHHHS